MKTEFSTPKDLEKLRVELSGKMGGGIDPNHPDMGPIMDSLIMTNDRPHIDCSTITPLEELKVKHSELAAEHEEFSKEHAAALERSKLHDKDMLDKAK